MESRTTVEQIKSGDTALGIELGSTRIKAVLVDSTGHSIASGSFEWSDHIVNGMWSYSLKEAWAGLQAAYAATAKSVYQRYGIPLERTGCIGISAMMHGYLVFDQQCSQLVPFRTWRNTVTELAAARLSEVFQLNIPQRWSIAHLDQALLNCEPHTAQISYMTTLAGYIHWQLTGQRVLGINDASGMFPINCQTGSYREDLLQAFSQLPEVQSMPWHLENILPQVLPAGTYAGSLTQKGALLLDPTGTLHPRIPFCPPEGDAGTGMVATNSIRPGSGNISAGTSIFSMVVMKPEHEPTMPHSQVDIVVTPNNYPAAMIHCNTCTSDLNAWAGLFREFAGALGTTVTDDTLYSLLYRKALESDHACGGLLSYCFYAGEPVVGIKAGCPLFLRPPDSPMTLANFMRAQLYTSVAALRTGMDLLTKNGIRAISFTCHGGLFKTPEIGQQIIAAALNTPATVLENASEGGAWGIALLALFQRYASSVISLTQFLDGIFSRIPQSTIKPEQIWVEDFNLFLQRYQCMLPIVQAASEKL